MFRKPYLVVWLVVLLGILVSAGLHRLVAEREHDRQLLAFEERAADSILAVESHIGATIEAVHSIAGFYQSSKFVDRDEFRSFVSGPLERYPGIQALEWIPRVTRAQRWHFEESARMAGYTDFRFTERRDRRLVTAGERDEYYPVYYVEPEAPNQRALGFDLASNPTRRAALEAARTSGKPRATGRITLVQETGTQFGTLIFVPVFKNGGRLSGASEPRSLLGFALGVFRVGDMVAGAFDSNVFAQRAGAAVDLYIYDIMAPPEEQFLHVHSDRRDGTLPPRLDATAAREGFHMSSVVTIAGRNWLIIARPHDPSLGGGIMPEPWLALFGGLAITLLLAAYLASVVGRSHTIQNLVKERTRELARSEARAHAILDNTVDGIIVIDATGMIRSFNPAAERIFGSMEEDVVGRNVRMLMPEPYHSEHDGYIKRYLDTGEARVIGIGREVTGQRRDGSTFPMELAVSVVRFDAQPTFVGIVRDLTERKKVERMKQEFVSTVSHELRTPLTSIIGSLGLLKGGAAGTLSETAERMVTIAHDSGERLVRLINDILDIEKIESGNMPMTLEPLPVPELIESVVSANQGYAQKNGVQLVLDGTPPERKVRGDRDRLTQVLTNLIGNAVKFSPEGARVELSATTAANRVHFSVRDHGPGIPADFRDRIFSRFSQADSSDTRQKGGTGLGLAITRAIVESHNGRIWFDSELGQGSTFHFEIPEHLNSDTEGGKT